ncbi:MAG: FAD-binding oxidoreductase, partial [Flavobacteriaceae bacterium]
MDKFNLEPLGKLLEGELLTDSLNRSIYATDASVYRKTPLGVAFPKTSEDLKKIIRYSSDNRLGLIPRTAGTSLAGQCVGDGIVVDVSRYFTAILDLNLAKKQVTVEPGVIRDELNRYLEPHGLFFGPNTSTSNRCMIGGMAGNNSSGTTSIKYGVTRDKVVSLNVLLSDGSEAIFGPVDKNTLERKCQENTLEGKIYNDIFNELSDPAIREEVIKEFPNTNIHRRNTGYSVDSLINSNAFEENKEDFNIAKLLCGSEGTLAFTTAITLQLDDLPPQKTAMVVTHYACLPDCLSDVAPVMKHSLHLCEMMDKVILDCTKNNRAQMANRFFVSGDPAALLMLQLRDDTEEGLQAQIERLLASIQESGFSYAHPVLKGEDIAKAIELRKAGLGLLGNMVGDRKAVACIEDTAVAVDQLKSFITEFTGILERYGQQAVYYAHAGAGELHLRPILNLKKSEDIGLFRSITTEVAHLTKRYGGSFSGEHGDGIVRAEFIPLMVGKANYELFRRIKNSFDPRGVFNPGKIVDPYLMDESL